MYLCAHTLVRVEVRGHLQVSLYLSIILPHSHSQGLSLNPELSWSTRLAGQRPPGCLLPLLSPHPRLWCWHHRPAPLHLAHLNMSSRDLNSGSCPWATNMLSAQLDLSCFLGHTQDLSDAPFVSLHWLVSLALCFISVHSLFLRGF